MLTAPLRAPHLPVRCGWQDATLGNFGDFAEPHYRDYVRTDFAALARQCGFEPESKDIMSSTKTLSFIKM
jgi:hypothetical protein